MKKTTRFFRTGISFVALLLFLSLGGVVLAEQINNTPESGAVSRIKAIYDSLLSSGYGSDSAGSWGDWGAIWNRIRSSAEWTPQGNATANDVISGKTFYSNSRELSTGTAPEAVDYSLQALEMWDDLSESDFEDEESTWSNTYVLDETGIGVWRDERTGLYWTTPLSTQYSNYFDSWGYCSFFGSDEMTNNELLDSHHLYDGSDEDCGEAINACGLLSHKLNSGDAASSTNWYLPSIKEIMQAYQDGIYNNTTIRPSYVWAASGIDGWSTYAYVGDFSYGWIEYRSKSTAMDTVCVAREN